MCLFCNDIFIDLYRTHVNLIIKYYEKLNTVLKQVIYYWLLEATV